MGPQIGTPLANLIEMGTMIGWPPPSSQLQAECKMLCFNVGKCLGKCVGNHVVGRAINKINCPIVHDKSNKMIPYVDVFGTGVIRPVAGKCDSGLRV